MSLQVWLPLNGNLNNQGLSNTILTNASATVDDNGKIGKCYKFTSSQYLYNDNFELSTSAFSVCYWVKYSSFPAYNGYVVSLNNTSSSDYQFMIGAQGTDGNYTLNASKIPCKMELNKWYHCAVTWQGTTAKMYLNGELVGTYTVVVSSGAKHLTINGRYGSRGGMNFVANDVRIYDHCLSQKEIKEISKGLVLHYKLSDTYLEGTTNLYTSWGTNCYNGATNKYNYGTTTDIYNSITDGVVKITTGTSGLACYPYIFFNNITPAIGSKRTLSFDYFPSVLNAVVFYSYSTSGNITYVVNGTKGTGGTIPVKVGEWNHLEVTIENTGTTTSGFGYMRIGSANHTSDTQNYWLFKNIQIEDKDYATGYIPSGATRPAKTVETDCSGFKNNGTISNLNLSLDTSRYSYSSKFNGTSSVISTNSLTTESFKSVSFWLKVSTLPTDNRVVFADYGSKHAFGFNSGGFIVGTASCSVFPKTLFTANEWHNVVLVYGTEIKMYIDGTSVTKSSTNNSWTHNTNVFQIGCRSYSTPAYINGLLSDFRVYATELTEYDVKELYSVKASIDNKGNLFCGEVVEK